MKNQEITLERKGDYNYGRCDCCNKKFTRTTRGIVVGKADNSKYYPNTCHSNDWAEKFTFLQPKGVLIITLVKLGRTCFQNAQDKGTLIEITENQEQPLTLKECRADYVLAYDKNGIQQRVKRGKEFIQFMIKNS
jgi:hypothetical protein